MMEPQPMEPPTIAITIRDTLTGMKLALEAQKTVQTTLQ